MEVSVPEERDPKLEEGPETSDAEVEAHHRHGHGFASPIDLESPSVDLNDDEDEVEAHHRHGHG
jgi:hypothetical protein